MGKRHRVFSDGIAFLQTKVGTARWELLRIAARERGEQTVIFYQKRGSNSRSLGVGKGNAEGRRQAPGERGRKGQERDESRETGVRGSW